MNFPWFFRQFRLGIVFIAAAIAISACDRNGSHSVTFRVQTANDAHPQPVFIAGNHALLGGWDPGSVDLNRTDSTTWERTLRLPAGSRLEYKFTRGSWASEALGADGTVPGNATLHVTRDTTVEVTIRLWRDAFAAAPPQITGEFAFHRNLEADGLKPRDVVVWLPPSYKTDATARFPVLYMHDGQNAMDPNTSFNGRDWQIDEAADSLMRAGAMREIIIVGIYNTDDRNAEYSDSRTGAAYRAFITGPLKSMIDATYRTLPGREHTATLGSSMGGLVAFLLVWKHDAVFGMAACLSPAFIRPYDGAVDLVRNRQGPKKDIRIYMDNGGVGLEARLQPGCDAMLAALRDGGYETRTALYWYLDRSAEHNEAAWSRRVWRPLVFLFPPE